MDQEHQFGPDGVDAFYDRVYLLGVPNLPGLLRTQPRTGSNPLDDDIFLDLPEVRSLAVNMVGG